LATGVLVARSVWLVWYKENVGMRSVLVATRRLVARRLVARRLVARRLVARRLVARSALV